MCFLKNKNNDIQPSVRSIQRVETKQKSQVSLDMVRGKITNNPDESGPRFFQIIKIIH